MHHERRSSGATIAEWVLCPEISVLCLVAALLFWEAKDVYKGNSSPGAEMRPIVQGALGLSCLARAGVLLGDILNMDPKSIYRLLPSIMFLSSYSLLGLLWAQLYFTSIGVNSRWLRPAFLSGLVLLYLAFVAVCVFMLTAPGEAAALAVQKGVLYGSGTAYLAVLVFLVYFGVRASMAAQRRVEVFRRILVLCVVCWIVLFARGVLLLLFAVNVRRGGTYDRLHVKTWYTEDAICCALLDILPSIIIFILTRKARRSSLTGSSGERYQARSASSSFSAAHTLSGRFVPAYGATGVRNEGSSASLSSTSFRSFDTSFLRG